MPAAENGFDPTLLYLGDICTQECGFVVTGPSMKVGVKLTGERADGIVYRRCTIKRSDDKAIQIGKTL